MTAVLSSRSSVRCLDVSVSTPCTALRVPNQDQRANDHGEGRFERGFGPLAGALMLEKLDWDRRRSAPAYDGEGVSVEQVSAGDPRAGLLALYDQALPEVYGYLLHRCGRTALAEDLTAETFLAAVDGVRSERPPPVSIPWLIGVARHKLVDHWRRQSREERSLNAVADDPTTRTGQDAEHDPWDAQLDAILAHETLQALAPQHRAALTLRYLDDLPVPEVARALDRTVHATEALLVRARSAFRAAYSEGEEGRP